MYELEIVQKLIYSEADSLMIRGNPMKEHEEAITLVAQCRNRVDMNEADTRHQIINQIIHKILSWPIPSVRHEEHNHEGYSDFVFYRPDKTPILVLEAKREGNYFTFPQNFCPADTGKHVTLKTLLTNKEIADAIKQVRTYCLDIGCQFGAITNGHEWIFFRVFLQGEDWRNLKAFAINGISYFSESFTEASNNFSYVGVTRNNSLNDLLSPKKKFHREAYHPKSNIHAYSLSLAANSFAPQLRPIADNFFGAINASDTALMEFCYVSDKEYDKAFDSARHVLADSLTPYLREYNIKDTKNDDTGGEFGNRIQKSIRERKSGDVVVLFGGKGVGKSTFLRRLLYFRPPQLLKKHAITAIIDLLDVPKEETLIHSAIWSTLINALDTKNVLESDRESLLALFKDKYDIALKQTLYGLSQDSAEFNSLLNNLVQEWKNDKQYCAKCLAKYHLSQHRGVVVVIDNTDQFGTELQEFCFTAAHEISKLLSCLVIISMREERFYASTIHGVLDAYQNSGFHISSPSPRYVFLKRLQYVIRKLRNKTLRYEIVSEDVRGDTVDKLIKLFSTFEKEFESEHSHLANFLSACAHGNIRLALELFRGILQSRYTNVNEITSIQGLWTYQIHQVLKPIMIPFRFFYEESQSHVPNMFQVRSKKNGSHFTALRILQALSNNTASNTPQYISVPSISAEFFDKFNMEDDFYLNLDILLKYGLIESSNRIDEYSDYLDSIRLTTYGRYLFDDLSKYFTYLDLVATDTVIFDQSVSETLSILANEEYSLWEEAATLPSRRKDRVQKRLEKTKIFLNYLLSEENREKDEYGLKDNDLFVPLIIRKFQEEAEGVLRSASKQRYNKQ